MLCGTWTPNRKITPTSRPAVRRGGEGKLTMFTKTKMQKEMKSQCMKNHLRLQQKKGDIRLITPDLSYLGVLNTLISLWSYKK